MPSRGVVGVVRNQARLVNGIWLGEFDARVVLQRIEDVVPRRFRNIQDAHIDLVNGAVLLRAVRGKKLLQF